MTKTLLVIECTENYNWYERFAGATIEGEAIKVEQATWQDVSLVAYPDSCVISLRKAKSPLPGTPQNQNRTITADFIFLRSVSRGVGSMDSRGLLLGLLHHNLPAVNSLSSAFLCCERSTTFAALKDIQKRLGKEAFPLVAQTYYASGRDMLITPDFPIVCKIGHAQSGYGKMRITNASDLSDFRSVCAMHEQYVTAEPFIEWDWDGRVQKIGSHYRAFRRTSAHWKGNVGNQSVVEEIEPTEEYIRWADECAKVLGGLDILGLDFLHCKKTGKYYILELNDTAIGLVHDVADEDMDYMRDLVLTRMKEHFYPAPVDEEARSSQEEIARLRDQVAQLEQQVSREKKAREEAEATLAETLNAPTPKRRLGFLGM